MSNKLFFYFIVDAVSYYSYLFEMTTFNNKDTPNNMMEKHNVVKEAEPNKEG